MAAGFAVVAGLAAGFAGAAAASPTRLADLIMSSLGHFVSIYFLPPLVMAVLVHASVIAIDVIEHLDNFHAIAIDNAKGSETLTVERGGIVANVDKQLRGAGVGARSGEHNSSLLVALAMGVILNSGLFPSGSNIRIGAKTELRDKAGNNAEKMGVIEIVVLHKIVEAVCAQR